MPDMILRFKKSASDSVVRYTVAWARNGQPAATGDQSRIASLDGLGYSIPFSLHNPGVVLAPGDVVAASVRAVDGSGLASDPVTPTVAIPTVPPTPPVEVTLTPT